MVRGELEKVPCGERGNLRRFRVVRKELILKASIKTQEHEEACWFWRGGCRLGVETKSTIPLGIEIVGHLSCHHSCGLRNSELVLDLMLDARDNRRRRLCLSL